MYPKALENLIESFKILPGVGSKTAERYALLMLDKSEEEIADFARALMSVKLEIKTCVRCGNFCEEDLCSICQDDRRNEKVICVVESAKDIIAMEKTREYKGVYHVLQGVLSSTKGILPEDINISSLIQRVHQGIEEVIIATNPTLEGETTAMYIDRILQNEKVLITRIAHGLPMGGHLDYADELTLIKAMENRKEIKK